MMFSEPAHILLFFDESEQDLWLALQQIEPDRRSAFIKATLRQALLTSIDNNKRYNGLEQTEDHLDPLEGEPESFSLDALFMGAAELGTEDGVFSEPEKTKHISEREPWEYLLNTVIGAEDDEAIINTILHAAHSSEE